MKKIVFLTLLCFTMISPAFAIFYNAGFETGDLAGWDHTGNVSVVSWDGGISPFEGQYMAKIVDTGCLRQFTANYNDLSSLNGFKYRAQYNGTNPNYMNDLLQIMTVSVYGIQNGAPAGGGVTTTYWTKLLGSDPYHNWYNWSTGGYYMFYPNPYEYSFSYFEMEIRPAANITLFVDGFNQNVDPFVPNTPVPEPSSLLLLSSGFLGLLGVVKKYRA